MVMGEVPYGSENSFWQKWELLGRADCNQPPMDQNANQEPFILFMLNEQW